MHPPFESGERPRLISFLGGLCFFLSAVEYLIPKPLPFIRLGLANLPLLLALDLMSLSSFLALAGIKVVGQTLMSGTLFSYASLFSLGGTGAAALLMYGLRHGLGKERISLVGIGTAGALAANGTQLVLARFLVFGSSARYAAAPVLALGVITGILLGACAEYFKGRSRWYARAALAAGAAFTAPPVSALGAAAPGDASAAAARSGASAAFTADAGEKAAERWRRRRAAFCERNFGAGEAAAAGLCAMPALLLNPDTGARVLQFLFFWFLSWLCGKKNNPIVTLSAALGIIFFNLLVPYGEVIFSAGPFAVTSGALSAGIRRAATLEGLFMLSRCCVRENLALPGAFGQVVGESFRVFSVMAEAKKSLSVKNWTARLDKLLLSVDSGTAAREEPPRGGAEAGSVDGANAAPPRGSGRGSVILKRAALAALVALVWAPLLL